jgi:TonB family protein
MRKALASMTVLCLAASLACAQNALAEPDASRKVISRIVPAYPELAKRMHLQGVVKVEAVIRPNGAVKSTRILGGSPVLVNAANDAVSKWKFEPGPSETTEVIELTFIPQ